MKPLLDWIQGVLGEIAISLHPPNQDHGITCYLLQMTPERPLRGKERPPLQIILHYLITAQHDDPQEAQRQIIELMFAAMANPEYEVEGAEGIDWQALNIVPQAAFILKFPIYRERPESEPKLVRQPLVLKTEFKESEG